ncbi:DAK2 domain-containing protein [Streptomyces olivaceus]
MTYVEVLPHVADALDAARDELAALDSVAGDGDLGITAHHIADVLRVVHAQAEGLAAPDVLESCALRVAEAAPSSFGTLVSFALLAAAGEVRTAPYSPESATAVWRDALLRACDAVSEQGGARAGQKTVLDAALPAVEALDAVLPLADALVRSGQAAAEGAERTATMEASIGRAGWSAERSRGHVDGGARLFAVAWTALASPEVR